MSEIGRLYEFLESDDPALREAAHTRLRWLTHTGGTVKAAGAQPLIDWFNDGADGQIDWGSEGDFDACVAVASKHMDPDQAKGFCNLRHHDATGSYPGQTDEG